MLPANVPGKQAEDTPSTWASVTYVGDLDGVPGSWLLPGPASIDATICRVNQRMEEFLSLSLSLPLYNSAVDINKSLKMHVI